MMQMFITKQGQYCPDCADTNQDVRVLLAAAHIASTLDITDDPQRIKEQTCEACQRLISEIPAYKGTYRLSAQITFAIRIELQARSATDAELQADEAIEGASFTTAKQDLKLELRSKIEDPKKITIGEWEYGVESASRVPPEQHVFVSSAQERLMKLHGVEN